MIIYPKMTSSIRKDNEEGADCVQWATPAAENLEALERTGIKDGIVRHVDAWLGILDPKVWNACDTIVQQANCVGCRPAGLAKAVSIYLPYGCPCRRRIPIRKGFQIAKPECRNEPGSIARMLPWDNGPRKGKLASKKPAVINMFAQWELGPAGKYCRVAPTPGNDDEK